jgi:hypothetical protein
MRYDADFIKLYSKFYNCIYIYYDLVNLFRLAEDHFIVVIYAKF